MANVTLDTAWFAPGGHYFFATEAGTYVVIPDNLVPHLPPKSKVLNFDASVVTHVATEAGENPAGYAIYGVEAPPAPKPVRPSYRLPVAAPEPVAEEVVLVMPPTSRRRATPPV